MAQRFGCVALMLVASAVGREAQAEECGSEDTVCVRGARNGAGRDGAVAATVVAREELTAPGLKATDVLRGQPGIQIAETGGFGAPATAFVRGATGSQTPIYLGGIRINDDVAGVADVSLVPLGFVHRIEIYRGHAPLEADRLGIGGAMFFDPRRPTRNEATVGVQGGSFRTQGYWARGAAVAKGFGVLAGLSVDAAKNDYVYEDDGGTILVPTKPVERRRVNADATALDAWALGHADLGAARLSFLANAFTREQGVPRLAVLPSRAARVRQSRALAGAEATLPLTNRALLELTASYLGARSEYHDPLGELSLQTTELRLQGDRLAHTASVRFDVVDRWQVRPVVSLAQETLHRGTLENAADLLARRVFGRFATAVGWNVVDAIRIHALVSAECHGTAQNGATSLCDHAYPTGRIGIDATFGPATLLGSFGRYVRVPTLGELFGISEVVRGNPALRPEDAWSGEAGLRLRGGSAGLFPDASVDVFGYARTVSDLVSYRRVGLGYVVPQNVQSARILGAEVVAGSGLGPYLRVELGTSLLDPRDTSDARTITNDLLPYRSRLVIVPRLRARTPRLPGPWLERISMDLRYVYQSSRFADPAGLAVIPDQGSCDLSLQADLASLLSLRARVSNLFDQYRTDVVGFPLPGRAVFASLESHL